MTEPAIRPMTPADEPAYVRFCAATYGPDAYQGRPTYLQWLYDDAPLGRGVGDALVATDASGGLVGCVHRMRLPWRIDGDTVEVPSLHNLMIAPGHRGGTGFFMLTAAARGEPFAFIPGVVGDMAELYTRLKYQRLGARWYRRVLRPDRAAVQRLAHRLHRPAPRSVLPPDLDRDIAGLHVVVRPPDAALDAVARALEQQATAYGPDVARVGWTGALVRWRYFSDRGPRHVLISTESPTRFAILSVGPRHGITVARVLAWEPAVVEREFLDAIGRVATRLGAAALFAFDAPARPIDTLAAAGWQPMAVPPLTFWYSRDKRPRDVAVDAGATDLGFESLPA